MSSALPNDSFVNNGHNTKNSFISSSVGKISLSILANLKQFSTDDNENYQMLLRTCQLVSSIEQKSFLSCSKKYFCQDAAVCNNKKGNKNAEQTHNKDLCHCHKNANKKLHLGLKSKFLINNKIIFYLFLFFRIY